MKEYLYIKETLKKFYDGTFVDINANSRSATGDSPENIHILQKDTIYYEVPTKFWDRCWYVDTIGALFLAYMRVEGSVCYSAGIGVSWWSKEIVESLWTTNRITENSGNGYLTIFNRLHCHVECKDPSYQRIRNSSYKTVPILESWLKHEGLWVDRIV